MEYDLDKLIEEGEMTQEVFDIYLKADFHSETSKRLRDCFWDKSHPDAEKRQELFDDFYAQKQPKREKIKKEKDYTKPVTTKELNETERNGIEGIIGNPRQILALSQEGIYYACNRLATKRDYDSIKNIKYVAKKTSISDLLETARTLGRRLSLPKFLTGNQKIPALEKFTEAIQDLEKDYMESGLLIDLRNIRQATLINPRENDIIYVKNKFIEKGHKGSLADLNMELKKQYVE